MMNFKISTNWTRCELLTPTVLNWVSRVVQIALAFLYFALWWVKNLHHFLNQSVWKLKPTESWSLAFYCILSWSFVWVWFYNNQSYCTLIFEIVIFSISDLSLLFTVCTVLTEFDLTFGKSSLQKQHKKSTMRNKYSINIYMEAVE